MSKPGRNDRCPCGSGRKYKVCCLARDEAAERAARSQLQAVDGLLDWCEEAAPGFLRAASDQFFHGLEEAEIDAIRAYVDEITLAEHIVDWALGDAVVPIDGEQVSAALLLARPGAPNRESDTGARAFALTQAPLRLWRVAGRDSHVRLVDCIEPDRTVAIADPDMVQVLVEEDIIALRVAEVDGAPQRWWAPWQFSGPVVAKVRRAAAAAPGPATSGLAEAIVRAWLDDVRDEMALDETGVESTVVTDSYEIPDRSALLARFDEEGVLSGEVSADEPASFFLELDDLKVWATLKDTTFDVSSQVPKDGDLAREWLEEEYGDLLRFASRTIEQSEYPDDLDGLDDD